MEILEKRLEKLEELIVWNKDILTIEEASSFLDLKKSYLYKLVHLKKITHYKPNGKKLYFKREDLIAWLTSRKIDAQGKVFLLVNDSGEEIELRVVANNKDEVVFSV